MSPDLWILEKSPLSIVEFHSIQHTVKEMNKPIQSTAINHSDNVCSANQKTRLHVYYKTFCIFQNIVRNTVRLHGWGDSLT